MRWPVSGWRSPGPTARTRPSWGFSFAVSGRTIPLFVISSRSRALMTTREPSGLSLVFDLGLGLGAVATAMSLPSFGLISGAANGPQTHRNGLALAGLDC